MRNCLVLLLVMPLLTLQGCATNPVTGEQDFVLMSEAEEIALGRRYSTEIIKEMPEYDDPELQRLVQSIGEKIAANSHRPDLIYRFTVVDSPTVNAFALPGGYIYITRGMLAYLNSEAELAAVLGHEIGHVTARHSVRQHGTATAVGLLGAILSASSGVQGMDRLSQVAGTAIVRGYGRDHELEADRLGAEYLAKTGYDPAGMLKVVGVLKNQEAFDKQVAEKEGREPRAYHGLFSTHPDNDKRFQEVVNAAQSLRSGPEARVGRDSFLRALDGLTFGESEAEGITREHRFYHGELDFGITFPVGWRIDNGKQRVLATAPGNDGLVQLSASDLNKRISPEEFMRQRMKLDNLRNGKAFSADGLLGYTAIADGNTPWGTRRVRYIVLFRDDKAWIIAGAAKNSGTPQQYDAEILAAARSFHRLTKQERAFAQEKHLQIIKAKRSTRYSGLVKGSPINSYPEEQLRLLNNQYPDGEPRSGSLLKIVR